MFGSITEMFIYLQRVNNSHGANIQKMSHIMMISNKKF